MIIKMPRTKQVSKNCTMEKFASMDVETRFNEIYCEK